MIDATQELEPLPSLPPNQCVLAVMAAPDRAHTFMRLTYNVTALSEDRQKLLLYMLTNALTELEKAVKKMDKIEVAKKLAQRERIREFQGNGQPPQKQ